MQFFPQIWLEREGCIETWDTDPSALRGWEPRPAHRWLLGLMDVFWDPWMVTGTPSPHPALRVRDLTISPSSNPPPPVWGSDGRWDHWGAQGASRRGVRGGSLGIAGRSLRGAGGSLRRCRGITAGTGGITVEGIWGNHWAFRGGHWKFQGDHWGSQRDHMRVQDTPQPRLLPTRLHAR